MRKVPPHKFWLTAIAFLFFAGFFSLTTMAQTGCPGCAISLPPLPNDTIFLSTAAEGIAGQYYDTDISFRMPKTTTPVNATDPSTPAGLPISNITINSVVNVPPGLSWEANQMSFNPSNQPDGCVKFCGTPLQPGVYNVEVFVTATVLTIGQSTSFSFPITILPAVSNNDGFAMQNNSGCGAVTVSFQNNVQSNGNNGYAYAWDFGNGTTSNLENPPALTFSAPGVYEVKYAATIDTFGYQISTVRVLGASCDDVVLNVPPDLYLKLKDPLGNLIYTSSVLDNVDFPAIFNVNLFLTDGTYELEVRDEDTFGSESCGYVYFTKTNSGVLVSGDLEVQVDIIHPVVNINSSGFVTVYEQPADPILVPNGTVDICIGESIDLVADYDQGLQWYQDTIVLFGETSQALSVNGPGAYWVEHTSLDGCRAQSAPVAVIFSPLPNVPTFNVTGNEYALSDPSQLPADYTLQWFMDGAILPGENGPFYCLMQPGVFLMALQVTNNSTGCTNEFSLGVSYNPAFTCASAANEVTRTASSLVLSPNPTWGDLMVDFTMEKPGELAFQLFDSMGKLVKVENAISFESHVRKELQLGHLPNGTYQLKVQTPDGFMQGRVVKL
ncbi:MAG: T9SS type A sorting domain-containing protein [Saprospiraceae bacterium]|nr:T9SS type A sorting domain-containing protein [Saprospiraceae bacterium]